MYLSRNRRARRSEMREASFSVRVCYFADLLSRVACFRAVPSRTGLAPRRRANDSTTLTKCSSLTRETSRPVDDGREPAAPDPVANERVHTLDTDDATASLLQRSISAIPFIVTYMVTMRTAAVQHRWIGCMSVRVECIATVDSL